MASTAPTREEIAPLAPRPPLDDDWTYERYLTLDDEQRYEIFDGELSMVPAPFSRHQLVAGELFYRFDSFVRERKLGLVLFAPVDVVFGPRRVVQPDLLFIRTENLGIIGERAVHGAPDLVVEILSPGSLTRDRYRKYRLYEQARVPEYWIVDPANRAIEVLALGESGYELIASADEKGPLSSRVLEGFTLELSEVLEAPAAPRVDEPPPDA